MPKFSEAEIEPAPIHISKLPFRQRQALVRLEYFIADTGCADIYPDDANGLLESFQGARAFLTAHVPDNKIRRLLEYHYHIDQYAANNPPRGRPHFNTVAKSVGLTRMRAWRVTQETIQYLKTNRTRQDTQTP